MYFFISYSWCNLYFNKNILLCKYKFFLSKFPTSLRICFWISYHFLFSLLSNYWKKKKWYILIKRLIVYSNFNWLICMNNNITLYYDNILKYLWTRIQRLKDIWKFPTLYIFFRFIMIHFLFLGIQFKIYFNFLNKLFFQ